MDDKKTPALKHPFGCSCAAHREHALLGVQDRKAARLREEIMRQLAAGGADSQSVDPSALKFDKAF